MNSSSTQFCLSSIKREHDSRTPQRRGSHSNRFIDFTTSTSFKQVAKSPNNKTSYNKTPNSIANIYYTQSMIKKKHSSFSSVNNDLQTNNFINFIHNQPQKSNTHLMLHLPRKGSFSCKANSGNSNQKIDRKMTSSLLSKECKPSLLEGDLNYFDDDESSEKYSSSHQLTKSGDVSKYKIISCSNLSLIKESNIKVEDVMSQNNTVNNNHNEYPNKQNIFMSLDQFKIKTIEKCNEVQSNTGETIHSSNNDQVVVSTPAITDKMNETCYLRKYKIDTSINNRDKEPLKIKSLNNFINKPGYERERRRMKIELLKIEKAVKNPVCAVHFKNNINQIVLKQEEAKAIKPKRNLLFSSYYDIGYSEVSKDTSNFNKTNISFAQINQFLNGMNDIEDKPIYMINFLSVPRIMNIIHNNYRIPFIFVLSPDIISSEYGIEAYLFKWRAIDGDFYYYFDLFDMKNSYVNIHYKNQFKIYLENNSNEENIINKIEIEAPSSDMSKTYSNTLNLLCQLIKSKRE